MKPVEEKRSFLPCTGLFFARLKVVPPNLFLQISFYYISSYIGKGYEIFPIAGMLFCFSAGIGVREAYRRLM
ncbi:hypothetical protein P4H42_13000 [Paenibacillus macerans]|uniref:hypothetical protein n=1 Tax=Paenibacillus macerans TaxID=44252 RepID=UPI001D130FCD|nr:hypothetical protein [Paenibacillus macerans]MBS5914841.1 hypothetical protein [Paenibacillus macerans]MEC0330532.1 hypothetical protein [Paenibacillus macerans]